MARYFGFNVPFYGGANNILSRQEDLRLIKNDIIQLILTLPGERVHRPNFGSQLRTMVFGQLDEETMSDIESEITSAVRSYEPRLINIKVFVNQSSEHEIQVKLTGNLTSDPTVVLDLETTLTIGGN